MDKITEGIERFQKNAFPAKKELFGKLANGQAPKVLLITCSDSRVVPSLITDSEPGDLFVIRNAGNMVPPYSSAASGEEATVEYAVAVLGVEHIIVCGHSGCGAMNGLLNPASLSTVPSVAKWLELARPSLEVANQLCSKDAPLERRLATTIESNALRQLDNLRGYPAVAAALARGAVSLHAWVYHIGSGAVTAYDEDKQAFVNLEGRLLPVNHSLQLTAAE